MMNERQAPILYALPAHSNSPDSDWKAWCPACRRWHFHSPEEGHRVAHCEDGGPFEETGYYLKLAPEGWSARRCRAENERTAGLGSGGEVSPPGRGEIGRHR